MDDIRFYAKAHREPLPVDHEYSWRQARWRRRRKACIWAGAGLQRVQGRGHIVLLPTQLVYLGLRAAASPHTGRLMVVK